MDLAKTMGNSIGILMVDKREMTGRPGEGMTDEASAEQEEGAEPNRDERRKHREALENKLSLIKETCSKAGVSIEVSIAAVEVIPAIRKILSRNARIDMVVLSPGTTNDGDTSKTLQRLLKSASRKIVTMAKQTDSV